MEPFPPPNDPSAWPEENHPPRRRSWRKWLRRLGVALLVWIAFQWMVGRAAATWVQKHRQVSETVVAGEGEDKIAIVPIRGALMRGEEGAFGAREDIVADTRLLLERAEDDPAVKGVLLYIDSPGGGITESDEIHRAVMRFRASGKRVLALLGDTAASGGYYVACAAERIMAQPTTITGSIGVMSLFPDLSQLARHLGVSLQVVKSGPLKDMGAFWRPLTETEERMFAGLVDEMYQRFVDVVWESRKEVVFEDGSNTRDYWRSLADGRVYTAAQAYDAGLVDEIGYREEAVDALLEWMGLETATVVEYAPPRPGLLESFLAQSSQGRAPGLSPAAWAAALSPRIMAIWTGRR